MSISCFYVAYEQRYDEYRILGAAILKFKMAASYHGDGYQVLYESTHAKLPVPQFSCFCQNLHDSYEMWALTAVLVYVITNPTVA